MPAEETAPPNREATGEEGLAVVPLSQVPTGEILDLLRTCLGPAAVERSEAFWRWKHEANPFGPSPGLVATAGGRPVAVRVFLRWRWRSGDRELTALRAVDTATHPEWRRRGLFRRLTGELVQQGRQEGASFVFNTPNPTSRQGYLALGWRDVGRLPVLVRFLRPGRMLATRLSPSRRPDRQPPSLAPLRSLAEALADPELPPFLAAWGSRENRLHTQRSVSYLRWRYGEAPGIGYAAHWSVHGESGALTVVRVRRRGGLAELSLVELLVSDDPAGRRAADGLIRDLATLGDMDYLAAVAAPPSTERIALRRAGFLPVPRGPRLTVLPLGPGNDADPTRLAAWRPMIGDLELF